MKCAYCEKEEFVLIKLPITCVAKNLEREVIGNPEESICKACVIDEMFDVIMDDYASGL